MTAATATGSGGADLGRARGHRRLALAIVALLVVPFTVGCASAEEQVRSDAVRQARTTADALRVDISEAVAGASTSQLPERVRQVTSGLGLVVAQRDDGTVVATGAIVRSAESGGGLWYRQHVARACLAYTVAPDSVKVSVRDIDCGPTAPSADETVRLHE